MTKTPLVVSALVLTKADGREGKWGAAEVSVGGGPVGVGRENPPLPFAWLSQLSVWESTSLPCPGCPFLPGPEAEDEVTCAQWGKAAGTSLREWEGPGQIGTKSLATLT